jgi:hypothetical protein
MQLANSVLVMVCSLKKGRVGCEVIPVDLEAVGTYGQRYLLLGCPPS